MRLWAGHELSESQLSHLQDGVVVGRVKTTFGKCPTVDKWPRALREGRLQLWQLLLLVWLWAENSSLGWRESGLS